MTPAPAGVNAPDRHRWSTRRVAGRLARAQVVPATIWRPPASDAPHAPDRRRPAGGCRRRRV